MLKGKKVLKYTVAIATMLTLVGCSTEDSQEPSNSGGMSYEDLRDNIEEEQELEEDKNEVEAIEEVEEIEEGLDEDVSVGEYEERRLQGIEELKSRYADKEVPQDILDAEEEYFKYIRENYPEWKYIAVWFTEDTRAILHEIDKENTQPHAYQVLVDVEERIAKMEEEGNIEEALEELKNVPNYKAFRRDIMSDYRKRSTVVKENENVPELLKGHAWGITNPITGEILTVAKDGKTLAINLPSEKYTGFNKE